MQPAGRGTLPWTAERNSAGRTDYKLQVYVPILHLATHDREVALDSVKASDAWEQSPAFESKLFK